MQTMKKRVAMINRRDFLRILAGAGASLALPFDLSVANDAQIDLAWSKALRDPVVFDVDDRTIFAPWESYPVTYADVFDVPTTFANRKELMSVFNEYDDLQNYFYYAFEDAASVDESLALNLYEQLDMDDGLDAWIQQAPLDELATVVDNWLASDLPSCYEIPPSMGPMGAAYSFFLGQEFTVLQGLGIAIVEGEHPGSSYFAAELRIPVEEANHAAAALDIPIRFKEAGDVVS